MATELEVTAEQTETGVVLRTKDRADADRITGVWPIDSAENVKTVVPADETDGMETNRDAIVRELEENGFGLARARAISDATILVHTETLPDEDLPKFVSWAEDQDGYEKLEGDIRGQVWRVHI